ncbi:hypothetical protein J6590_010767 [Homalodisca vitripennis]|nr:hypothetical protein J6590_010767 [Homalodisca vitripennis]
MALQRLVRVTSDPSAGVTLTHRPEQFQLLISNSYSEWFLELSLVLVMYWLSACLINPNTLN